jgi:hypothetical protein
MAFLKMLWVLKGTMPNKQGPDFKRVPKIAFWRNSINEEGKCSKKKGTQVMDR